MDHGTHPGRRILRGAAPLLPALLALAATACSSADPMDKVLGRVYENAGRDVQVKQYGRLETARQMDDALVPNQGLVRSTGKGTLGAPARLRRKMILHVSIPRDAVIVSAKAYMKNNQGPGNCDLGTVKYVECPIDGGESAIGLAEVRNMRVRIVGNEKLVSVEFYSWSECNRRSGKLEVDWKPAGISPIQADLEEPEETAADMFG